MPVFAPSAALLALLAAQPAAAAPEPGVWWEQTVEMQLAGGFSVPPQTMKVCVPKKQEWKAPPQQPGDACKVTDVQRSGARMSWKMACDGGVSGEGEMSFAADTFSGKTLMRTPGGEMRTTMKGRKLGGDCDANAFARDAAKGAPGPRR